MQITIAICDNEKYIRESIMQIIKNQDKNFRVDLYDSASALLLANIEYDIYVLDIQMPDINGIKLAEQIRARQETEARSESIIIFVSALNEYMADAFDVKAYHYLVKPIDENKFNSVSINEQI